MGKVKITIEADDLNEPLIVEGNMYILNVANKQENGLIESQIVAYGGGTYPDLTRLLVGTASYIHNIICEPTCKYSEQLKKEKETK
jgi:hypothetical protein